MADGVEARLHDGNTIVAEIHGEGPALLLPVDPVPVEGDRAEEMRRWGADPALGRTLVDGLSDAFRVVAFDYEGHVLRLPKPATLTPANISADLLAVADAAGVQRFAYYGYSWLALSGLQLALRTDRLTALAMGGYPPLDGPTAEMLTITRATHALSLGPVEGATSGDADWDTVAMTLSEEQTRQFVTLYEALQDFDDRAALARLSCPRLCLVGSADEMTYGERWGGVHVSIARPVVDGRAALEAAGWQVRVLDGLDHMSAMQAGSVLPVLRPWLSAVLPRLTL